MRIQYLNIGNSIYIGKQQQPELFDELSSNYTNLSGKGFKSLSNFEVHFEEKQSSFRPTVILGENGTGKTNLLEAIVIIFRDLDLNEKTDFAYTIIYECRGNIIKISSHPDRNSMYTIENSGRSDYISKSEFHKRKEEFLPKYVFCYYSGSNSRFERILFRHQNRHYRNSTTEYSKLSEDERLNLQSQRFFYARTVHSKFVLLSFFTEQDKEVKDFLKETFGILGLESVLFILHKPDWARTGTKGKGNNVERFWRAEGLVKNFLENLYEFSAAPIELNNINIQYDFKHSTSMDLLCLYLKNQSTFQSLTDKYYPTQRHLFDALQSTFISDLLEDVKISIFSERSPTPINFSELSEGEQQLLTVFGLLRFTKQEESLILLDEPDTHINPVWGWKYFEMLNKAVYHGEQNHLIMVTHDPLVISPLESEQVQLLNRSSEFHISSGHPRQSPRGAGIAGILMSEIYGLKGALDKITLEMLEEKRELSNKSRLTVSDKSRLKFLREKTEALGFTRDDKDPDYKRFLDAMYARKEYLSTIKKDVLTEEDIINLEKLALEVLKDIDLLG